MVGDALQQRDELPSLGLVERRQQLGVVFVGGVLGSGQPGASVRREVHRVGAAVAGVAPALHEPALLELVDQPDHRVAMDPHSVGELLLALPVARRKQGEQPEVRAAKVERPEPLGEALGAVEAELGQQEPGTPSQRQITRLRTDRGCSIIG